MSGKVIVLSIMFIFLILSCGDSPSAPSGPDYPTPSVLSALFTGGWFPPDTSKGVSSDVQLSWTVCPDSNFLKYTLYKSTTQGIETLPDSAEVLYIAFDPSDTAYTDKNAEWDASYYYAIRTTNYATRTEDQDSLNSWSNEVFLTIPPETSFGGPDILIKTIYTGTGPGGIAALPSGNRFYVACYYDNSVYVLEPYYPYIIATVQLSGGLLDICSGSEYVYVSCSKTDEVSTIRTSDNTAGASCWVGDMPSGLCITPDGSRVYVCCYGSDEVWCLDASTLSVLDTISVGDGPWDICTVPSGDYLYLTCRLNGTAQVIRVSDNTLTATIDGVSDPAGICSSSSGEYVYICDYSASEVVPVRTSDNYAESGIDVGSCPMNIAVVPNGSLAYVTSYMSNMVQIIDLTTSMKVSYLTVGIKPNGVCLSSSGEYLFVSSTYSNTVSMFGYSSE